MIDWTYQHFASKPRWFIVFTGWLLLVLVGAFDISAGKYIEIQFFYLAPILLITWFSDRASGIATAVLAVLVVSFINNPLEFAPLRVATFSWVTLYLWNAMVKLVFFLSAVIILSRLKDLTLRLQDLASQDSLTSIANRRSCIRAMEIELSRLRRYGSTFAVAYIDLDDFKTVNDRHGHEAGDLFLRRVADTIRRHTRNMDTVARLGGDEFAIVLPETDLEQAEQAMKKIQHLLARAITRQPWQVTLSIGVVAFLKPPQSAERALKLADHAMYSVKRRGKNNIVFESWPLPKQASRLNHRPGKNKSRQAQNHLR